MSLQEGFSAKWLPGGDGCSGVVGLGGIWVVVLQFLSGGGVKKIGRRTDEISAPAEYGAGMPVRAF